MRVVIIKKPGNRDDSIREERAVLEPHGIDVESRVLRTEEEIIREARNADGLIVANAKITRKVLSASPGLKVVVKAGVGVDNIDLKAAEELGKYVANVPDACTEEVAVHALALALVGVKRIHTLDRRVRGHGWGLDFRGEPVFRMSNMTLGLVGFGRIARKLGYFAERLVRNILFYDPYAKGDAGLTDRYQRVETPQEVFGRSAIVSLHTPLDEETRGLIDRSVLSRANGIVLVNTGRAPTVNAKDLETALDEGRVACFCSDVFWNEPADFDDRWQREFLERDDVIVTPHAASFSIEGFEETRRKAAEEVLRVLTGQPPANALAGPKA